MSTRSHAGQGAVPRTALVPLAAARARLLAGLSPVAPQRLPLHEALGFTLAEDVLAPADSPPAAVALRAGFAVRALETVGAGPYAPAPLLGEVRRLAAGDPLPAGCDALLPEDALDRDGPVPLALAAATPGDMIRRAGEDVRGRARLCAAGGRLTGAACAAMAAAGLAHCAVRVPRLRIDGPDGAAAFLLRHLACRSGVAVVLQDADIVALLASASGVFEAVDNGLGLRPGGEDMAVGTHAGAPAVVLPNRPETALAAWFSLLLPGLEALSAASSAVFPAILSNKVASTAGFADIVLLAPDELDPARWQVLATGDLPWSKLAVATAVGLVPAESEGFPPGFAMPARFL